MSSTPTPTDEPAELSWEDKCAALLLSMLARIAALEAVSKLQYHYNADVDMALLRLRAEYDQLPPPTHLSLTLH
jgi:hypothetical protein